MLKKKKVNFLFFFGVFRGLENLIILKLPNQTWWGSKMTPKFPKTKIFKVFLNPPYDTFLESLGPQEYIEIVSRIFGHHQDDQEGQECPKTGVLEDFGCLDGGFDIVTPHMIPFWNPWDHGSTQEQFLGYLVTIRMIRNVKNVQKLGFQRILGVLMGVLTL